MATPITERINKARAHLSQLRHISEKEITADLTGRERASAIIRARTQYNAVYSAVKLVARGRKLRGIDAPTAQQQAEAQRLIDDAHRLFTYARRFSVK
ncbi:MAG: hypothetical protein IPK79_00275 [Vampirovibrionales bacterium]|nr:hypothetical protein [Vampirovibrionales bacterium]